MAAALLALLTAFVGFYLPDAREALAEHPLDALQMVSALLLGGLVGIFAVHRAERMNRYLSAGGAVTFVSFSVLLSFWLLSGDREAADPVWMIELGQLHELHTSGDAEHQAQDHGSTDDDHGG